MTEPSAGELRSSFQSPAPPPHPKRAAPLRNVMQSPDPGSGLQPVQPSGKSVEVRKVEEPKALRPISQGKRNNPSWRFSDESPLHIACYEGNVQKVNTILSQTPQDVSLQASDGDLPIHRAASSPKVPSPTPFIGLASHTTAWTGGGAGGGPSTIAKHTRSDSCERVRWRASFARGVCKIEILPSR